MKEMKKIIGPFAQLVTMDGMAAKGAIKDEQIPVIEQGGIAVATDGSIAAVGSYEALVKANPGIEIETVPAGMVALPGLIDCHTHICFGGSRARDFAARNNGKTYQEIAAAGGGIWDTVTKTREATEDELTTVTLKRLDTLIGRGITTVEVKSGYGLGVDQELKLLRAIKRASDNHAADVVPTCLAAHIVPREFANEEEYLKVVLGELVPVVQAEKLAQRFDIFTEENAFSVAGSKAYLKVLKAHGFDLTVHGDQFTAGGSEVAIEVGAMSVDHLEASGEAEIAALAKSETIPVVLPGCSLGLGIPFSPARKLLDAGCSLAIASDWNPGSAPQGNLLTQAALLGTYEKLSTAEVFAGITYRAAAALGLSDRGALAPGQLADLAVFPTHDFREILYHQGEIQASLTWKRGEKIR